MLAPGLSAPCLATLSEVWTALADAASGLEVLADAPSTKGSSPASYALALRLLTLPPATLPSRAMDPSVHRAWTTLFTTVSSQVLLKFIL